MELVYLWVEKYKNIRRHGFNFSPRFRCKYDPDTNELTIDDNNYIENFFGNDINVTAIVGKNGSGKSSLLELLLILTFKAKDYIFDEYGLWCIVFDKEIEKFKILTFSESNFGFTKIHYPYEIENIYMKQVSETSFFTIHYNFSFEQYSSSFVNLINTHLQIYHGSLYDFDSKPLATSNAFSFPNKKYNKIDLDEMDNTAILLMFKTLNENIKVREFFNDLFKTTKLNFIPSSVTTQLETERLKQVFGNAVVQEITLNKTKDLSLESLYILFINIIMSYWDTGITEKKLTHYFLDDTSPIFTFIQNTYNELSKKFTRVTIEILVRTVNDNMDKLKNLFKNNILLKQLKGSESLNTSVYSLAKLIDSIHLNEYSSNVLIDSIEDSNIILNTLPYLPEFVHVDVMNKEKVKFSDFSYGEKNIIAFLYSLMYHLPFYSRNTSANIINILIDEIESGLNPFWQQKIVLIIQKIISFFDLNNKMVNIIITSHSPFLLSDIPKQNIIFLDTYKESDPEVKAGKQKVGNCKVVDGLKEKKETFGANIHTLLSDSFFMEDGLMGEFAREKIDKAFELLNKQEFTKEDEKYCELIISIVGEPIIKSQMQKMLDSKRLKKVDKIEELEKHIADLQKQVDEMKNNA